MYVTEHRPDRCSFCENIPYTSKMNKYGVVHHFCVDCINDLKEVAENAK